MMTIEEHELTLKIQKAANAGTQKARETARKAGLPIPFARNGRIYYELPDGSIVEKLENN